jgi:hypothetical protein
VSERERREALYTELGGKTLDAARRCVMELSEAMVSDDNDEIIEITLTGDEVEWQEIAAVLKESDSDLATEIGLRILDAVRNAGS